jgi:hypothetical protein
MVALPKKPLTKLSDLRALLAILLVPEKPLL